MEKGRVPPEDIYTHLYECEIINAKEVFGKHFTCKITRAPHFEEFQVAVVPMGNIDNDKFDNVEVCLTQGPACFMHAYLRNGNKRILRIGTRSGTVSELWSDLVYPVVKEIADGNIGFRCNPYHKKQSNRKNIGGKQ